MNMINFKLSNSLENYIEDGSYVRLTTFLEMGPHRNAVLFSMHKTSNAFERAYQNWKKYKDDPLSPANRAFYTHRIVKYLCDNTFTAHSENIFINEEFVQQHFSPIFGLHTPLMPAAKWLYNHGFLARVTALVLLTLEMIYEALVTYLIIKPRILLTSLFSSGAAEVLKVRLADTEHATKLFGFIYGVLWHPENDPPPTPQPQDPASSVIPSGNTPKAKEPSAILPSIR